MMPLLTLNQLSKNYQAGDQTLKILQAVNLEIEPGEFVVLHGSSGSGKSTLLQVIAGLDRIDSGAIFFRGLELTHYSRKQWAQFRLHEVGFLFQFFNLFSSLTVLENILFPTIISRAPHRESEQQAWQWLDRFGLKSIAAKRAHEISGGEKQRVALCRALMLKPSLLLADEPTGNLDQANGVTTLQILQKLSRDLNMAILMATHDPGATSFADKVLRMKDGKALPC